MAVVMVGYSGEMRQMLRNQNPGLSRRFNPDYALNFEDFSDQELLAIIALRCRCGDIHAYPHTLTPSHAYPHTLGPLPLRHAHTREAALPLPYPHPQPQPRPHRHHPRPLIHTRTHLRASELDIKCSVDVKLHAMTMLAQRRNVAHFGARSQPPLFTLPSSYTPHRRTRA